MADELEPKGPKGPKEPKKENDETGRTNEDVAGSADEEDLES